jgi:TetR/AcrR family transcriptional repressor of nem operon
VCKGSFYHFFASKVELAIAVLENDWISCGKPNWDALFSASKEPLIRIQNYLEWLYEEQAEVVRKHGRVLGCLCCCVGSEMSTLEEPIVAKAGAILGSRHAIWNRRFAMRRLKVQWSRVTRL